MGKSVTAEGKDTNAVRVRLFGIECPDRVECIQLLMQFVAAILTGEQESIRGEGEVIK